MPLTPQQKKKFEEDGYIVIPSLFTNDEIKALSETAHSDLKLDKAASARDDGKGNAVRLPLWNHPGDSIYGMFARAKKLVSRVEDLLGGEVYHYHSKMVLKDAKVGGAMSGPAVDEFDTA